jgi:hypothetical protein
MLIFWHNLGCNKEVRMSRKRYTAEKIIGMLRAVEVELSGIRMHYSTGRSCTL